MAKLSCTATMALGLFALGAAAAELPDCKLDHWGESRILDQSRPTSTYFLNVKGELKNDVPLTFARDGPVLVADLGVSATRLTVIPSADVRLKSSWALSMSYRFAGGAPIPVFREVHEGGRKFLVVRMQSDQVLFIDEQDRFCSKALNAKSHPNVWAAGTLTQEPEGITLEHRVVEEPRSNVGFRAIFVSGWPFHLET